MKKLASLLLACGLSFGVAASGHAQSTSFTFTTLAGTAGTVVNSAEGSGSAAQFYSPRGVAVDSAGNVYVADSSNNTIRKVTAAGAVTTFAGMAGVQGRSDGTGSAARFLDPYGVAVDGSGNIFVADTSNNTIRKITSAGVVTTFAGTAGTQGSVNGTGTAAQFREPRGVAVDGSGNVYVADYGNHVVRKITAAGVVTTLAGSAGVQGSTDGTGSAALFRGLLGVAVDSAGNVYVADTSNRTIRKITAAGVVTTLAGAAGSSGSNDGSGTAARFSEPRGLAVDAAGTIYVADYGAHTIRKVTAAGVVTTIAGTALIPGSTDAAGTAARFYYPSGVTVDSAGNVYVADTSNNTIRKLTAAGVVATLAGLAGRSSSVDGTGTVARFEDPYAVAAGSAGNVYVADATDHSIRKITSTGIVTTFAGSFGSFGSTDGAGSAARFFGPLGIAADSAGTVYVADTGNHAIRKITSAGVVSTFAGTAGSSGNADGTGAAARFSGPNGIALDGAGNLYVADTSNNTIRKITPAGVVTTLAGTAGTNGLTDGAGSAARFSVPFDVAADAAGNVYVSDHGNHAVRKITAAGMVTTLAGSGSAGSADGTGSAASFRFPTGIAVDSAGTVFLADTDNHVIRQITAAGAVTTVGGAAGITGSADGAGSAARFFNPKDVSVDSSGNLYVADRGNHTIRKGTLAASNAGAPQCTLTASPNLIAGGGSTYLFAACSPAATSYTWTNSGFAATQSGGKMSPAATATYSVIGSNASGSGAAASATVTVGAAARIEAQALFVNASTSTNKTSVLRVINPTASAGTISATAFDESGNLLGSANATLGTIAANQTLTFSSAALEQLLGFTPGAPTAKYAVYLYSGLPALQLINYTSDIASGALTLSQSLHTDRSSAASAASVTRTAWFLSSSTSTNKTNVLRLINTSSQSGTLTASLYDENGLLFGSGNMVLGTIAARQMLSYTSAQLESALGYTPLSPTAKYRVVFNATLPSLELINFTKDIASGNLALVQAQIDDRPASAAASSSRMVLLVNPSISTTRNTVLRIVNPNSNAAAVTAVAYDEAGNVAGSGSLGSVGANQILALTSAQIEAALGYVPSSAEAKYRLLVNANVPSFEVIDNTKLPSNGNLYLAQAQTDNRTAGSATTTTRNAYILYPSSNAATTTELRVINTTAGSAALTATAYDDSGTLIGSNVAMGTLAPNQMQTFTSAQLESLFGYSPGSGTKWRLILSAGLSNFEVLNYAKEVSTGLLVLAQPQTE